MDEKNQKIDDVLDTTGLMCPLPAVKTALKLEGMDIGQTLEIITTDEISKVDLPEWCKQTGNDLIDIVEDDKSIHITIRKAKESGRW